MGKSGVPNVKKLGAAGLALALTVASACAPATPTPIATVPPVTPAATVVVPASSPVVPIMSPVTPAATSAAPVIPPVTPAATPATTGVPGATATTVYTIKTMSKSGIGAYLVDITGQTLYYFTRDSAGVSNANATVIQNWPTFSAGEFLVPPELNASDFSTITRDDGIKQTTFRGWPLYYYINDKAPGDTNGQGVGGVWFVVDPNNFPPTGTPAAGSTTTTP